MPRRQRNRAIVSAHGELDQIVDRRLERGAADQQRVDRAEIVSQRDLRTAVAEIDGGQPAAMVRRPRRGGRVLADVVAQQQLAHPVACAHQIAADVLPRADEIPERLLLAAGDANRVQPVDHQQPQQPLGVALIGLDASLDGRSILPGAAITHCTPAASSARASPKPVGPAS
jgi:hypothetical protein